MRSRNVAARALLACLALAGCGGGSAAHHRTAQSAGTIRMALAGVPTLDPARATTAQETELDWALYTGLITYRHARGVAGTELIPGVASGLPQVSDGGRLYTLTLRPGLRFWNGRPLRAADVVATFERTIRTLDSPVRPLLLPVLQGAAAFAAGRTASISGVSTDARSGRITIRLLRADPGFDALLAEPALGLVPSGTPIHERPGHPPAGIGPYRLERVRPGRSFLLARNPYWKALPGLPGGQVDIDVILSPHTRASALAVLNNVLDVQDPTQSLPQGTLAEISAQAGGRATQAAAGRPLADLFLGVHGPPFDARLAREGVIEGLGAQTLGRAAARTLSASCDVVPLVAGSATPDGCPVPILAGGALAGARSLVARSGTAGAAVTVWAPRTGPERGWMLDVAAVLRAVGYVAQVITVPDATYRSQLAALVPRPVSGDPRHPSAGGSSSVHPMGPHQAAKTSRERAVSADGVLEGRLASVMRVAAAGTVPVAIGPDVALSRARRDATVVFAEPTAPELMSWRMDESAAVIDPVEGLDFTSLRLR